jgi:hypothetical protein
MKNTRRFCFLVLALMLRTSTGGSPPDGDSQAIAQLFRTAEAAITSRNLEAALVVWDPAQQEMLSQAKGEMQGWLTLSGRVRYRIASLSVDKDSAEAVVLRQVTFREYDREQVDARWENVRLRRLPAGWRIVSEGERTFVRTANTELGVELFPSQGMLRGVSRLKLEVTAPGEDVLLLQLNRGLEVKSLTDSSGASVPFERDADSVSIRQAAILRTGDVRSLTLSFEGKLFNEAKEQGYSQVSIAPAGSFASWVTNWYPRLQGTGSKSAGTITYEVPRDVTVASSGRLSASSSLGHERRRDVFTVDRPIDFSFAAAKYFHREENVNGVRLGVYFLGGGDARADLYLREATRTLRYEEELYGAYPFDGYAVVEIPSEETGVLGGSSEQGMNLFPAGVLPDGQFPLLLLAHEMGHSWWGNLVSSASGPIIDEGLAQISAVMCLEHFEGPAVMRRFLKNGMPDYQQSASQYFMRFAGVGQSDYPLGVLATGSKASAALHDIADTKGMFVYEMLRESIGQTGFVAGLQSIIQHFKGKAVSLQDLRAAWEASSGKDLTRFFEEWFGRTGAPELTLDWRATPSDGAFLVSGTLTQKGEPYTVTVDIALLYPGRHELRSLSVASAGTPFSLRMDKRPDAVLLDPEYRVLRWTEGFRHAALLGDATGLASMGRNDEALAKLQSYVAKAPESLEGRYRLGLCDQQMGKLADAERSFRFVLDRYASLGLYEPAVSLSQLHLGEVLDLAGGRDDAKTAYRSALALPDVSHSHAEAQAGLATPYVAKPKAATPGLEVLARYAGAYDNQKGLALRVSLSPQGILMVTAPGQPEAALVWLDSARFRTPGQTEIILEFVGSPQVTALDLTLAGKVARLPRMP